MRIFKMLSFAGATLLAVCSMSASAAPVSCAWVTDNGGGYGGYATVNQSCKDGSNFLVAQRVIQVTPNATTCSMTYTASGISNSGTCLSPSFYNSTPVSSSSSSSSSSLPTTKVVNGVTIPYTASVISQGTCYSYGCQSPSQYCYSQYGTFAMAPYPSQNYVCYRP